MRPHVDAVDALTGLGVKKMASTGSLRSLNEGASAQRQVQQSIYAQRLLIAPTASLLAAMPQVSSDHTMLRLSRSIGVCSE